MENEFNALFSVLDAFVEADPKSSYGKFASEMQETIMRFGREYQHNNENHIELSLYQNEAQNLISVFIVYESVFHKSKTNYYERFHQYKNSIY